MTFNQTRTEGTATNSTFAIGGVFPLRRDKLCSADSFVVVKYFVIQINISGKNTAHRKSAKR